MYEIRVERWSDAWWSEASALANAHFHEVDGGLEPNRPFIIDETLMALLDQHGALKLVTARQNGAMVGYYTWNIQPDVESKGLIIGQQGAWYVAPGHPRLAAQTWDFAVEMLRGAKVQCIYPHHRTNGRGAKIGRFFQRRGAKKIQDTYSLWIGD